MNATTRGPHIVLQTPGFAHYSLAWSPFHTARIALASSANFGLVGNGRLHLVSLLPGQSGTLVLNLDKQFVIAFTPTRQLYNVISSRYDTQDGLFDVAWSEIHENQLVTASGDGSIRLWDTTLNVGICSFISAPNVIFLSRRICRYEHGRSIRERYFQLIGPISKRIILLPRLGMGLRKWWVSHSPFMLECNLNTVDARTAPFCDDYPSSPSVRLPSALLPAPCGPPRDMLHRRHGQNFRPPQTCLPSYRKCIHESPQRCCVHHSCFLHGSAVYRLEQVSANDARERWG
jgi:hypothetical protein